MNYLSEVAIKSMRLGFMSNDSKVVFLHGNMDDVKNIFNRDAKRNNMTCQVSQ